MNNTIPIRLTALAIALAALTGLCQEPDATSEGEIAASPGLDEPSSPQSLEQRPGNVFILPLEGPIDKALMMVFRRAFREVKRVKPDALVLEVNTPGGSLEQTKEIGAWLLSQDIPVYAFVNTDALSAGAILSLATDKIFMHPSATIGSALPILLSPGGGVAEIPENVEEKILSATRSLVRAYAQQKGHNEQVAAAMVDPSLEVVVGDRVVCAEDKLLNLTAQEATEIIPPQTEPLLAEAIVTDLDELLTEVGLKGSDLVRFEVEPAEQVARFIVALGPILFTLGIIGIFIELKTPGFGVPGMAGLSLLALFFLGHYIAGLAGAEDIALVALGIFLLALEVFVIPGFGIAGVSGIILISVGTIMAMIPHLPELMPSPTGPGFDGPSIMAYLEVALVKFVVSVVLAVVGVWLLSLWLPRTNVYSKIVLNKSLDHEGGYVSHDDKTEKLVGARGVAATLLRPAGMAMFGSDRVDVVTTGELIAKGEWVRVVEVSAGRVVVEKDDSAAPSPAAVEGV